MRNNLWTSRKRKNAVRVAVLITVRKIEALVLPQRS
jgi:hypothetical protein